MSNDVRLGGVQSPVLFSVYLDELLIKLNHFVLAVSGTIILWGLLHMLMTSHSWLHIAASACHADTAC